MVVQSALNVHSADESRRELVAYLTAWQFLHKGCSTARACLSGERTVPL